MTVSANDSRDQHTGTGANTELAVTFEFFDATDIVVTSRVTATGAETPLTNVTHYAVGGGAGSTGTVTPAAGATDFPDTVTWTISRAEPTTQTLDLVSNDAFPSANVETRLDRLTMKLQELEDAVSRSIRFPITEGTSADAHVSGSVARASTVLGFDSSGDITYTTLTTQTAGNDLSHNYILNGNHAVWQRYRAEPNGHTGASTTYPNDDEASISDRWTLYSDGDDVVDVTQGAAQNLGCDLDIQTADTKFGIMQWLDIFDSTVLAGETVSLSVEMSSDVDFLNVRIGIVEYALGGTIPHPVSAWQNGGNNPDLDTNFSYASTPAALAVGSTRTEYTVENVSISANVFAVGVFVWNNQAAALSSGTLTVHTANLVRSATAETFVPRPYMIEIAACRAYFESVEIPNTQTHIWGAIDNGLTNGQLFVPFATAKYATPTMAISTVTDFDFIPSAGITTDPITSLSIAAATEEGCALNFVTSSTLTAGEVGHLRSNPTGFLDFRAEPTS